MSVHDATVYVRNKTENKNRQNVFHVLTIKTTTTTEEGRYDVKEIISCVRITSWSEQIINIVPGRNVTA